jgi:hypothetical protein
MSRLGWIAWGFALAGSFLFMIFSICQASAGG